MRDDRALGAALTALSAGDPIDAEVLHAAMTSVLTDQSSEVQLAGLLMGLQARGLSSSELVALAEGMLRHAEALAVPGPLIDIVGTGGDHAHTVNISSMAATVVASGEATVVKHGNRASSSLCGSADVLEVLGVRLDLTPAQVAEVASRCGITFAFAQVFHPSMRHAARVRKELGVRTPLNLLGPLTNPAQPQHYVIGVARPADGKLVSEVLLARGQQGIVVCGHEGVDELTLAGPAQVWVVKPAGVLACQVDAADVGLAPAPLSALRGGDAERNAAAFRATLAGEPGPILDAVLLNSAAGFAALSDLSAATTAQDVHTLLSDCIGRARDAVVSGSAAAILDRWVETTSEISALD